MNHPLRMFDYHAWANGVILGRIKELPASTLHQDVHSSYPTIAHALSHMYAVDTMWYQVLTGTPMREAFQATLPLNGGVLSSVDEYVERFVRLTEQFRAWFRSQPDLEQSLLLDNPFAGVRDTRLSEIVFHMVNHGSYHRGNVSTMLRQCGYASAMNDYALYWYQEPAATT